MLLSAKWFDPVIGIDIHLILTPAGVTVPVPHPFIGIVYDPMGLLVGMAIGAAISGLFGGPFKGPVLINGLPAANTGMHVKGMPVHIPIGGTFVNPPSNEGTIITGSKTVNVLGTSGARLTSMVITCNDPVNLPTSVVMSIPAGPPVFTGGPTAVDWVAAALSAIRTKWVSDKLHALLGVESGSWASKLICFLTGHPVDVATGRVITDSVDFTLPAAIPFRFERTYYSASTYNGPLGHGWHHTYDQSVRVIGDQITLRTGDGRTISFGSMGPNRSTYNASERLWLQLQDKTLAVKTPDNCTYVFRSVDEARETYRLTDITDRNGNAIRLQYFTDGSIKILDTAGRTLTLVHDEIGRLGALLAPDPDRPHASVIVASYRYDSNGDLVAVNDALGNACTYSYKNHLLISETDRDGLSFYFEYDAYDSSGSCIHTWGDDGLMDRKLHYHKAARVTVVENSIGARQTYCCNELGLVDKFIDGEGGITRYQWDGWRRRTAVTNPEGETTRYEYDASGNLISITDGIGNCTKASYGPWANLVSHVDQLGNESAREYDQRGNLMAIVNAEGNARHFTRFANGKLASTADHLGNTTKYLWNTHGDLEAIVDRTGIETQLFHDVWGRLIRRVDAQGGSTNLQWNLAGHLLSVSVRGQSWKFSYDREGHVVSCDDPFGRSFRYEYGPLGALTKVESPSGKALRYEYDSEARLIAVEDGRARKWTFRRDSLGNVVEEHTLDGRCLHYAYDKAGRLTRTVKPGGRAVHLLRDKVGRVTSRRYSDGATDLFEYDARGRLITARNASALVQRDYDTLGRIIKESINGRTTESRYDAEGRRVSRTSPRGRVITMTYDAETRVKAISDRGGLLFAFQYDSLGRECERLTRTHTVTKKTYADLGHTKTQRVEHLLATVLSTERSFNLKGQIEASADNISGPVQFGYDLDGLLINATYSDKRSELFLYDDSGDVYGSPEYPPSQPELEFSSEVGGWNLRYDCEGNLIKKSDDSLSYEFEYDSAGRLTIGRRASRLSGRSLTTRFTYDPLGRRISKASRFNGEPGESVEFDWDGDTPLGETRVSASPPAIKTREYLFRPGAFEPLAVLDDDQVWFVHCDQLGTPRVALDENGEVAWGADYSVFGMVNAERGIRGMIPFRFPGQLADDETGLYYNRFRYYDPELRRYTTADPLGLSAGTQVWNYVRNPLLGIDPFGLVDPYDIKFSQDTIDGFFRDVADVPEKWRGKAITEAIEEARALGQLPEGLELNAVLMNGEWVTLNNRTLFIAREANLPQVHPNDLGASGFNELDRKLRDSDLIGPVDDCRVRGCS